MAEQETTKKVETTYAYAHNIEFKWPYGNIRIDRFQVTNAPNVHGQLGLRGVLDPDRAQDCMDNLSYEDTLELNLVKLDGDPISLFKGKACKADFAVEGGRTYIALSGVSHSCDMDIKKKNRSWQDENNLQRFNRNTYEQRPS